MTPAETMFGIFVLVAFGAFIITLAGAQAYTSFKR